MKNYVNTKISTKFIKIINLYLTFEVSFNTLLPILYKLLHKIDDKVLKLTSKVK